MNQLAILGASGHGKVVADAAMLAGWRSITFFDDAPSGTGMHGPWPIAGATAELLRDAHRFDAAVVAIGDNQTRLMKQRALADGGLAIARIVHPAAVLSVYAEVGEGTVILAGAVVNAFARLARSCIVNTGATVDHDCDLGDAVHVSPGAHLGGRVRVGAGSWIGIGASVRHNTIIGERVTVGAGAAVVNNIADGEVVVGVPARSMGSDRC